MKIKEEKNITVYRIENPDGVGPYSCSFDREAIFREFWQTRKHIKRNGCPVPEEDGLQPTINSLTKNNKYFLLASNPKSNFTSGLLTGN